MENEEYLDGCGKKLMDQKELAQYLMVAEKTLEHYRWKGVGPRYIKIGKLVRYRECDVIEWLKAIMKAKEAINEKQLQ